MDAAHQRDEDLSIMGILFANSVAEVEAVWMRRRCLMAAFFAKKVRKKLFPYTSIRQ